MDSIRQCSLDGCNRPRVANGWCSAHNARATRLGRVGEAQIRAYPTRATTIERFEAKVDRDGGTPDYTDKLVRVTEADGNCWDWTGAKSPSGYGVFWFDGRMSGAYRYSYELHVGPIARGYAIDHLCRRPSCVRPEHLDQVTTAENARRAESYMRGVRAARSKTHCVNGHEYSEGNTLRTARGARKCRTCHETPVLCDICGKESSYPNAARHRKSHREIDANPWTGGREDCPNARGENHD